MGEAGTIRGMINGNTRRRRFAWAFLLVATILAPAFERPAVAVDFPVADKVLVEKGKRKLHPLRDGEPFRTFDIALGMTPEGHKEEEGDSKTPEGVYRLDARNPDSDFFLSIHVSYPNSSDVRRARSRGVSPGGQIMIHGQPDEPRKSATYYANYDWTDGCIAVSNAAMVDIWQLTRLYTPISILP